MAYLKYYDVTVNNERTDHKLSNENNMRSWDCKNEFLNCLFSKSLH